MKKKSVDIFALRWTLLIMAIFLLFLAVFMTENLEIKIWLLLMGGIADCIGLGMFTQALFEGRK